MGGSSARVLEAIQPGRDSINADELDYPNLQKIIKDYQLGTYRWQVYGNPFRGQGKLIGRPTYEDLADTYLLQIAYRLQKAHLPLEKKFWSKRYTKTSISLFGKPLQDEVSTIATLELDYFDGTASLLHKHRDFLNPVLNNYKSLAARHNPLALSLDERYKLVLHDVRDYFMANYEEVFACFDDFAPNKALEPHHVAECFYNALGVLRSMDTAWKDWTIVYDESAKLSVNVFQKEINIGKYRAPIPFADIKGLFAHEVLVHALRCVNGSKVSPELAFGLSGYLQTEEGFGVLVESAVNERVANKVRDRYVDIALALGSKSRPPLTRHDLFDLSYSRAVARNITDGKDVDLNKLEDHTWEHVNRIYRGTLGNEYVGVFTKDVTYYQGFCKVADYLLHVLAQGKPMKDGVEYLLQGKFDPTDRQHVEFISPQGPKAV